MKNIRIPYAKSFLEINLPYDHVDMIYPNNSEVGNKDDESKIILNSLKNPVSNNLDKLDLSKLKIAIVINDGTRPLPYKNILPMLITFLEEKGADRSRIEYYIATGTHRSITSDEIQKIIPAAYTKKSQIHCHDCDDQQNLMQIGTTKQKTPVVINSLFLQTDFKMVTGNIEPHHFMGYSGGVKSAAIGLAARDTIEINHRMLLDPHARIGTFSSNPMRMDVEEMGSMIPVDLALNVVQNHKKRVEACFLGDPYSVMEKGIEISRIKTQINTSKKYDLVIASPGGNPKDINFYQAQKAISNACMFTKDGGVIIVIAACEEGSGNQEFEEFIDGTDSLEDMMNKFAANPFRLGPHKAFLLGLQSINHHIILVSSLPGSLVENFYISSASCFDDALSQAQKIIGSSPQVAVLPFATHCIPAQELPKTG